MTHPMEGQHRKTKT